MDILKVRDLRKTYRTNFWQHKTEVLKGVSFSIPKGAVTGFLGRNGAGKTTTIKCLLELAFPDSGTVEFFNSKQLTAEVKNKIGFLPERPYFYDYLTGVEFLRFYGELSRTLSSSALERRILELLEKVDLTHAKDRPLRGYSKGMLQRVGIAQALIHSPEFVLLDEPMSGLDPDGRMKINSIIREIANSGTTVFFSSHLLNDMEAICDHLVIMNQGVTIYEGGTEAFLSRLQTGYRLTYSRQGHKDTLIVQALPELQQTLDRLRSEKCEVLEIKNQRPNLEEAFVQVAFN